MGNGYYFLIGLINNEWLFLFCCGVRLGMCGHQDYPWFPQWSAQVFVFVFFLWYTWTIFFAVLQMRCTQIVFCSLLITYWTDNWFAVFVLNGSVNCKKKFLIKNFNKLLYNIMIIFSLNLPLAYWYYRPIFAKSWDKTNFYT